MRMVIFVITKVLDSPNLTKYICTILLMFIIILHIKICTANFLNSQILKTVYL
jgi:hypothetical protein